MKKYNYSIMSLFFVGIWSITVTAAPVPPAQPTLDSEGNITVDGNLVLSTPDMTTDSFTYEHSLKMNMEDIVKLNKDLSGGVKGTIQPGGSIKLEVFHAYDADSKPLLYRTTLTETSDEIYSGTPDSSTTLVWDDGQTFRVRSDKTKQLMSHAAPFRMSWGAYSEVALVLGGVAANYNIPQALVVLRRGGSTNLNLASVGFRTAAGAAALFTAAGIWRLYAEGLGGPPALAEITDDTPVAPAFQPVVVKLTINNATFKGAKLPGIGEIKPTDFFFRINLKVNGETRYTSEVFPQNVLDGYADTEPLELPALDVKMGDKITFEIGAPFFAVPDMSGIPDVWIARFAGDLMYYTTPSVIPGDHKAFLGYDTRVHNLMLRRYPDGFEPRYEKFTRNGSDMYTWSWVLRRRMDANKTRYEHGYEWPKTQTLAENNPITLLDGTKSHTQRRNQKEGLNMQYLTYWPDWQTSDFQKYTGTKYMLGFDDDELALFSTKCPNPYLSTVDASCLSADTAILKLERLPWKEIPEGNMVYNATTGYPESGFVLNEMVTAYKKHHNALDGRRYDGYEIQDLGTSEQHPDGNGTGNNAAPGKINIRVLKKPITLSLNVRAPLSEDRGFYGAISGTTWPSFGEQSAPYTLSGLQNLSTAELDKFSMEYEYEDKLGILVQDTRYLRGAPDEVKRDVARTGVWQTEFDIHLPSYASITAYYQKDENSPRVMIAGKELKAIFLLFNGVQTTKNRPDLAGNLDLLEGRGTGAKIWLEDFRDSSYGDYTVPRRFGNSTRYTPKYAKEYVFEAGDRVTFVTFDGDPHTFASNDPEWYLGSRYMAKRVTDGYLDGSINSSDGRPSADEAYLKYYIKNLADSEAGARGALQTTGRSGKEFTKTWNEAGDYEMEVSYRDASNLYYKIRVVRHNLYDGTVGAPILGRAISRDPTEREIRLLGLTSSENMKVAEVVDIYSRYTYVDGPRATVPKENRWAKQRDFSSKFQWDTDSETNVDHAFEQVRQFIDGYAYDNWFWDDWAHHYSSNWLRPPASDDGQGLPSGLMPKSEDQRGVVRIYNEKTGLNPYNSYIKAHLFTPTPPANWQFTIPLVSMTENQGPRLRTNPSSVYDLEAVFAPDTGAFSGNPTLPPSAESIQAPNITDDDKDKLELYYKIRNKQMIFFDSNRHSPSDFRVYNVDPNVPGGKTYIARCY